jgi:FKBP-type peptidyl-prolyl cis-trans isomerase FklB
MNTEMDKVSYIIGRQIGADFKQQGIEINFDHFAQGARSAFLGENSDLSDDETNTVMNAFQAKMQEQMTRMQNEMGEKNRAEGLAFLEENKKREGVEVTNTGLQYKRLETGSGKTPAATDQVEVNYEGTLIDGTVFDSSYQRGESITFPLNGVIPGWTEGLQLMKEGDTFEFVIPSELAYGARGAGNMITPHSTLKFKVELIKVL